MISKHFALFDFILVAYNPVSKARVRVLAFQVFFIQAKSRPTMDMVVFREERRTH